MSPLIPEASALKAAGADVVVVGGGLAGSEAAWQLAKRNFRVRLIEMRPFVQTPVHSTAQLAEIVCSNSFGGEGEESAAGILKAELSRAGSLILDCAHVSRVPAGGALAVDRDRFSELVSAHLESHPNIEILREEATDPGAFAVAARATILATGPLTSSVMAKNLQALIGEDCLFFFDAVAPIVTRESVDMEKAWAAGRYGRGSDYVNCPLSRVEYLAFYEALLSAERALPHRFEEGAYFEGCMPVEALAARGVDTLRFGPMKPVGLPNPKDGREPWAVVQLRQDNREGTLLNLVGFQTGLKWGEQSRLISMIPGLENADVVRFGVMHRNIYVNAPAVLDAHLRVKRFADGSGEPGPGSGPENRNLFLAGQITGVEGYMESTAMGLVAAINAASLLRGGALPVWPRETAMGSLLHYLQDAGTKTFQPMNMNLGIFPPLPERVKDKKQRARMIHDRALSAADKFWTAVQS
ncbi:MAG: methylenetetrahydrofolate--tRNA-(uracil(54)-C(5))-methyltransferase (FADH(2)-oxidizing) TrmFO [Synergistaceae bacterium]|jgi:methylenetetrahydrofolate--tRNA-(uracil-5-)-methyltransferase|nr:methylenetetrahydrofolate--tRNA-(uracil(54)-C(5))-methyltransferase (FADH(2)-oxidizing) TrmFO [Synergistaceae bacterium]